MVWHDDGVYMLLHVQCILLFRHNTRIQITFTSTLGFVYTSRYIRHSVSTHGAIWCIFLFGYVILQGGAYFPSKMPHTSDSMPKIHEDLMSTLHITQQRSTLFSVHAHQLTQHIYSIRSDPIRFCVGRFFWVNVVCSISCICVFYFTGYSFMHVRFIRAYIYKRPFESMTTLSIHCAQWKNVTFGCVLFPKCISPLAI